MQTAVIYGYSDDLVEVEGVKGGGEFPMNDSSVGVGLLLYSKEDGIVRIIVRYGYDGCWSVAVAPMDEDTPIPNWPVRFSLHENGYSAKMEMDVPDDTKAVRT